jgi:4-amino-4-deoxy-L-arabinose transferase-like glycosyltransferase
VKDLDLPRKGAVRGAAALAGLIVAAFALRCGVAFVALGRMPMVTDARSYEREAAEWLAGVPQRPLYWPPGTPMYLAAAQRLLGEGLFAARAATVLASGLTVLLAALVAGQLHGPRARLYTAAVGALYTPAVLLCGQSFSQHLAGVCLIGVAYFGVLAARGGRAWAFAACGASFGLGCLTRPSMLSLAPLLLACGGLALTRAIRAGRSEKAGRLARGALWGGLAAALLLVPIAAHNHRLGAGWTLSTNNERNLFIGNNEYTPDYKTSHLGQRGLTDLPADVQAYLQTVYTQPDARRVMKDRALEYMWRHPLRTLYRTASRARAFWGFDYLATRVSSDHLGWNGRAGAIGLLLLEAGGYLTVMLLAFAGLLGLFAEMSPGVAVWLVALVVAYQLPYLIAFSAGTYHFPVIGALWPFAGVALARAFQDGAGAVVRQLGLRAWAVIAVLLALQIEYAYHAVALSGS